MKKLLISILVLLFTFNQGINFANGFVSKTHASDDMSQPEFTIKVNKLLLDNKLVDDKGIAKSTLNTTLGTIIQKLMIALGSIALLIMTIGAGYMITYSGHDELLSKGKSIFNSGIISLVVALLSYYLVSLLRFILYS